MQVTSKAQSPYAKQLICKRCTEEHNQVFDRLQLITTDSMKIFSITFGTLVIITVYSTCKIVKDTFRIVLYVTTFYMQHCAVAHFVLKQWFVYDCTYVADMYNFVYYWKTSVFVLWINKLKCSLKTSVYKPGFSYWTLKTVSAVIKVTSS